MIVKGLTTKEVVSLTRMTKTMLDYLVRSELILPSVSCSKKRGQKRLYSFTDVVVLKCVKSLLDQGVSVKRLKDALLNLTTVNSSDIEKGNIWHYLVTDGKNIYLHEKGETLSNLNQGGQLSFFFVLELEVIRESLISDIQNMKKVA